jgi:hypothetical protein
MRGDIETGHRVRLSLGIMQTRQVDDFGATEVEAPLYGSALAVKPLSYLLLTVGEIAGENHHG